MNINDLILEINNSNFSILLYSGHFNYENEKQYLFSPNPIFFI